MNKLEKIQCVNKYLEDGDSDSLDVLIEEYVKFSKKHLSTNDDGLYGVVYEALMLCMRDFNESKASFNTRMIGTLRWSLMEYKNHTDNYKWLKYHQIRLLKKLRLKDDLSNKEQLIYEGLMSSKNSSYDTKDGELESYKGVSDFVDNTLLDDIKSVIPHNDYVIFMLVQSGYSCREIAEEMGRTRRHVSKKYEGILDKLRKRLKV